MAKFTTIKTTQTETGWSIEVDGTHYANAALLSEAKALIDTRPMPDGCYGEVEFTVLTIECANDEMGKSAAAVFPKAKVRTTCPKCKGTGKLKCHVSENGKQFDVELNCVYCNASGTVSAEELAQIRFEENMWCRCGKSEAPIFFDDGQHPEVAKHHYRCEHCSHVVQIG